MNLTHYAVLIGSAALAGAVNSVAGGGTLLTFPALLWTGQASRIANATSTVALWPGQMSSLWGYREEIGRSRTAILVMSIPSFLGGLTGSVLLIFTPNKTFDVLIPYLILLATLLFIAQEPLARYQRRKSEQAVGATETRFNPLEAEDAQVKAERPSFAGLVRAWSGILVYQFLVSVYGGYFGAGIGILMLASLGFMGLTNIHRMNGLKNINGMCINGIAAIIFIAKGLVDWRIAGLMAVGAILGGYFGAGTARRIGQRSVRRVVIFIGFALAISQFFHR